MLARFGLVGSSPTDKLPSPLSYLQFIGLCLSNGSFYLFWNYSIYFTIFGMLPREKEGQEGLNFYIK